MSVSSHSRKLNDTRTCFALDEVVNGILVQPFLTTEYYCQTKRQPSTHTSALWYLASSLGL